MTFSWRVLWWQFLDKMSLFLRLIFPWGDNQPFSLPNFCFCYGTWCRWMCRCSCVCFVEKTVFLAFHASSVLLAKLRCRWNFLVLTVNNSYLRTWFGRLICGTFTIWTGRSASDQSSQTDTYITLNVKGRKPETNTRIFGSAACKQLFSYARVRRDCVYLTWIINLYSFNKVLDRNVSQFV